MIDPSFLVKWLHILSSTILFGTGLGTAFYFFLAKRSDEPLLIAQVGKMVVFGDWLFTGTSGLLQPLTGFHLVFHGGYSLEDLWLKLAISLYVLAFLCWAPVVWLQIRMTQLARAAADNGTALQPLFYRYFRIWFWLGWPAFIALLAIFYLMVAKPV